VVILWLFPGFVAIFGDFTRSLEKRLFIKRALEHITINVAA
jgi:hypothetical protein